MTIGRLAVLSNVNMNMVIRMLQKQAQVYEAEGYGNELGTLLNPQSSYHAYHAEITFLIVDLAELLEHDLDPVTAERNIGNWFRTLEGELGVSIPLEEAIELKGMRELLEKAGCE